MAAIDWLPALNLLLVPVVGLLLSINRQLAALTATQAHHATELEQLRDVRGQLAALQAVQAEHGRRLDQLPRGLHP